MITPPPVSALEVARPEGRVLRAYDTGPDSGPSGLTVVRQHGSPQTGRLPDLLQEAAAARGIRLLSYSRPSYGGSGPQPGRTVADAAADVVAVLDAAGVAQAAVMASGGGPAPRAGRRAPRTPRSRSSTRTASRCWRRSRPPSTGCWPRVRPAGPRTRAD